jgi:hypothetical protein
MAYLGLVPSEHSSGASVRRDGLTKAGSSAARWLLTEAAWTYRFPARLSRELLLRQEAQPRPIREIAWKAQLRLCARYRKVARSGKPANVVTAAIARKLVGFGLGHRAASAGGRGLIAANQQSHRRRRRRTTRHAAAGQGWGRGRGQENPRNHYLPGRRPDAGS